MSSPIPIIGSLTAADVNTLIVASIPFVVLAIWGVMSFIGWRRKR